MTEKIAHTKGPWTKQRPFAGILWDVFGPGAHPVAELIDNDGDAELLARAREVPHHCTDPNCPGDINRRKLEAFEAMREALVLVRSIIVDGALVGFNCFDGDWAERLFASQHDSHQALALADNLPSQPAANGAR